MLATQRSRIWKVTIGAQWDSEAILAGMLAEKISLAEEKWEQSIHGAPEIDGAPNWKSRKPQVQATS
jgi:hypothetical protein